MGGTVITRKGMQLLVKLLATKSVLKFTRVSVGIGTLPDGYDPASLIDLVKYQMDGMISECKADGDVAKITMQISSIGIETGFTMTEMGVFAEDPDIGEILYAYLNMKEDPQYIYAEGGEAQKFVEVTLDVAIEASTKVTTYINPQSMITRETFDREIGVLNGEIVSLKYPKFDDSGEVEGITNFNTFMDALKSKISIFDFLRNLKAGLKFVLHTGQLVNNCVTDNPSLPLAAAQGKVLQDQLTKLNSDFDVSEKLQAYYNTTVNALAFNLFTDKKTNRGYGVSFNNSGITYSRIENGTVAPIWNYNSTIRNISFNGNGATTVDYPCDVTTGDVVIACGRFSAQGSYIHASTCNGAIRFAFGWNVPSDPSTLYTFNCIIIKRV